MKNTYNKSSFGRSSSGGGNIPVGNFVTGPPSAEDDEIAIYEGTTGKIIKRSHVVIRDRVMGDLNGSTYTAISTNPGNENTVWLDHDRTLYIGDEPLNGGGSSTGNVTGPASAVNNNLAAYDGTTGKLIKDSLVPTQSVVTLAGAQALSNKTITSPTNTVRASELATSGASVQLSGIDPPTSGQVLVATSGTAATWQSLPTSSGNVVGPATSVNNNIVLFAGTTGKLIKDSNLLITDVVTTSATQTIINKNITGTNNTVHASGFRTPLVAGCALTITQPAAGQAIVATSGSACSWQKVGNVTTGTGNPVRGIPMFFGDGTALADTGVTSDASSHAFIYPTYSRKWLMTGADVVAGYIGDVSSFGIGIGKVGANATGLRLTAVGYNCLNSTTGSDNIAFGYTALPIVTTGTNNTGIGSSIYPRLTTGSNNVGLGDNIGGNIIAGSFNILLGYGAGNNLMASASNNTMIGSYGQMTDNATIRISTSNVPTEKCFISGIYQKSVANSEIVTVDALGQLGSMVLTEDLGRESRAAADGASLTTWRSIYRVGRQINITLEYFSAVIYTGASFSFATVPESCRPALDVRTSALVWKNGAFSQGYVEIGQLGTIRLSNLGSDFAGASGIGGQICITYVI